MAAATSTYESTELTRKQLYEQLRQALKTDRSSFDAHWRELGEYFFPRRTRFQVTDRNRGERRSQNIINSTPRTAARTLQSGLHAGLTSPARPWMRLTTPDPDLAEFGPVKEWLHTVTQRMLTVFARSNLYNGLPTLYGDIGVFATGCMALLEDDQELLRVYPYPIGSYAVGLDARGVATTLVREYQITVRQLVQEFGTDPLTGQFSWEPFSTRVRDLYHRGNHEAPIDVVWVVTPNSDHDPRKLLARDRLPWTSCWYEVGGPDGARDGKFLRESGFREFPFLVPRWDVSGEDTYGTDCPGMTALGDAKGLQLLERQKAKAIAKAIDPPLTGPAVFTNIKTSLIPGDLTAADVRADMQGLRPIHEVRLEGVTAVANEIGRNEYRIDKAFFVDLFLMLSAMDDRRSSGQPVTAREIEERHSEKLIALGPVLERMNDELLDPLVDRAFALMANAGAIPPPPEEVRGQDLKVEYISMLSQAQKLVGVAGLDRFIQSTLVIAEQFPEARHKVRINQAIDDYGEMLGVSPKVIRPDDEADALADQERQAAAAMQQAEVAQRGAAAVAALGKTPLGGNTALDAVAEGMGQ